MKFDSNSLCASVGSKENMFNYIDGNIGWKVKGQLDLWYLSIEIVIKLFV